MPRIDKEQYYWRINLHKDLIELLIGIDNTPGRVLFQGLYETSSSNSHRYHLDPIYRNKIDRTAAGIQMILDKYLEKPSESTTTI